MANAIGGTAYFKVDGRQFSLRGNLQVSIATSLRTGVAGEDGPHGFTEAPRMPFFQGDFSTLGDMSIEEIQAIDEATVTCELNNGKTYVLERAWCASAIEINTAQGQFQLKFEGMNGFELN